jgi:NTE family protein
MLRPSFDIGKLCAGFEERLPWLLRYLLRGIGTHQTQSPDWLSMVNFDPGYLAHLLAVGEEDAASRKDEIAALIA